MVGSIYETMSSALTILQIHANQHNQTIKELNYTDIESGTL